MLLILALQPFYQYVFLCAIKVLMLISQCSDLGQNASNLRLSARKNLPIESRSSAEGSGSSTLTRTIDQLYSLPNIARSRTDVGRKIFQQYSNGYRVLKVDSNTLLAHAFTLLQSSMPRWLRRVSWNHVVRLVYIDSSKGLVACNDPIRKVFKTRIEVLLPLLAFQIQLLRRPWSLTAYSVVHCQSEIFALCLEGNLKRVQSMIDKSRISPFVVNQHGENLLHVSKRCMSCHKN